MRTLEDFLKLPDVSDITEDIFINKRLGTFTVKPMTSKQHKTYQQRAKGKTTRTGTDFDGAKFNMLVLLGQTIEPNFSDAEFLEKVGIDTATEFITKKFKAGEIADIAEKICEISGFDIDGSNKIDINEDIETAKN